MEHSTAEDLVSVQMQGLILHGTLANVYCLAGCPRAARFHVCQELEESKHHMMTNEKIIGKLGEIVHARTTESLDYDSTVGNYWTYFKPLKDLTVMPKDEEEQTNIHRHALLAWHAHEEMAVQVYKQVVSEDPECYFWRMLLSGAEKELAMIKTLMAKKFDKELQIDGKVQMLMQAMKK